MRNSNNKKSCSVGQNLLRKKVFFCAAILQPSLVKFSSLKPLLSIFSPNDSESLKTLNIGLQKVGAKRHLKGTPKMNRQTDKQTHGQTFWLIESITPEGQCFENDNMWHSFSLDPYCFCHFSLHSRQKLLQLFQPTANDTAFTTAAVATLVVYIIYKD